MRENERITRRKTMCEDTSIKWFLTVGTTPGYDLNHQEKRNRAEFAEEVQDICEAVYKKTNVMISAVIWDATAVYSSDFGCPPEGENVFVLSGSCNPVFNNIDDYMEALKIFAKELKEHVKQKTVTLETTKVDMTYMKDGDYDE